MNAEIGTTSQQHVANRFYAWRYKRGLLVELETSEVTLGEFESIYRMAVSDVLRATGLISPQIELMRRYIDLIDGVTDDT